MVQAGSYERVPLRRTGHEPSPAQARLIAQVRKFIAEAAIPEPHVIQPRPTNLGAVEVFWVEQKVCVVLEKEDEIEAMFGLTRADAPKMIMSP